MLLINVMKMKSSVTTMHFQSSAPGRLSTIHITCSQVVYMNYCSLLG